MSNRKAFEQKTEKSIRRALQKMGMYLRKCVNRETGESYYSIVNADETPIYGKGYTLELKEVSHFAESEMKAFRRA